MISRPGNLKEFTKAYLRRWDIQNVLTILRGNRQGLKAGKIKEILVPAGELDRVFLDRLLSEDSIDRIVEALKGKKIYPLLAKEYPASVQTNSLSRLENELYKEFYRNLINDATGYEGWQPVPELYPSRY